MIIHNEIIRSILLLIFMIFMLPEFRESTEYKFFNLFKNHTDLIYSVIQLKNGNIASGSYDHTIKIWDVNSGQVLSSMNTEAKVYMIIELGEGLIAACSNDKTIQIWNVNSRKKVFSLYGHQDIPISLLQLSEQFLLSSSEDNTITLWDLLKMEFVSSLGAIHSGPVYSLIKLHNGYIASSSADSSIKIWDFKNIFASLIGHTGAVYSIIQLDNTNIASASADKTVKIWNITTGNQVFNFKGHEEEITSVIKLPNGLIASGSLDGNILVWNQNSGQIVASLECHSMIFSMLNPSNGKIVAGTVDGIAIWQQIKKAPKKNKKHRKPTKLANENRLKIQPDTKLSKLTEKGLKSSSPTMSSFISIYYKILFIIFMLR